MTERPLQGYLFSGQSVVTGQPRAGFLGRVVLLCLVGLILNSVSFGAVRSNQKRSSRRNSSNGLTAHYHHFRYAKFMPLFPGSHDLLVEQNVELDRLQIPRMNNEYELIQAELSNDLVPVSETDSLKIAEDLMDSRRYCRPWTRDFLQDISQAFYEVFHAPLQVNSLVRTADQQRRLRRHNRFAAPEAGDTASTHLAGVTVDLSRRGLSNTQYQWIRSYLLPLQEKGLVNPIEERQPVLHIVVFEKYSVHDDVPLSTSEASEATETTELGATGLIGSQP